MLYGIDSFIYLYRNFKYFLPYKNKQINNFSVLRLKYNKHERFAYSQRTEGCSAYY